MWLMPRPGALERGGGPTSRHRTVLQDYGPWALAALLVSVTTAVLPALRRLDPPSETLPLWLLAFAFAATERAVVHLPNRRSAHTLTLTELPLVAGLFYADPFSLVIAHVFGSGAALMTDRSIPLLRRAVSVGIYGASTTLAVLVFTALRDPAHPAAAVTLLAGLAATHAASLLGMAVIAVCMSLTEGRIPVARVRTMATAGLKVTLVTTSIGLVGAVLWNTERTATALLLVPAVAVALASKTHVEEVRRRDLLDVTTAATHAMAASDDAAEGLRLLIDGVCEGLGFRSGYARVFDEEAGGDELTVRRDGHVALVTAKSASSPTPSATTSVAVPLERHGRLVGELVLTDRLTVAGPVGEVERQLLRALGHQAATLIRIDRLHAAVDQLRHDARTDAMTGLANRRALAEHLAAHRAVTVLAIDLDGFKAVNDMLGHAAGDEILRLAADRLRAETEDGELVVRLGGDEFVIVAASAEVTRARALADALIAAFSFPFAVADELVAVGASIGVSCSENPTSALGAADEALYAAKRAGKGRWAWADGGDGDAAPLARDEPPAPLRTGFQRSGLSSAP